MTRASAPAALLLGAALLACGGEPPESGQAEATSPDVTLLPYQAGDAPYAPWGYRTADGRVAIEPRFTWAGPFRDGRARVWLDVAPPREERPARRAWGYVARSGALAIPARYDAAGDFEQGRALVRANAEFVFLDTTGAVVAPLSGDSDAIPPLPSDSCASLEQYIAELEPLSPTYALDSWPVPGESVLALEVRKLRHGAVAVRERGWEGGALVLILPQLDMTGGRAIIEHLVSGRPFREVEDMFTDGLTWELGDSEWPGEFYRLRPAERTGIEIHHVIWAS